MLALTPAAKAAAAAAAHDLSGVAAERKKKNTLALFEAMSESWEASRAGEKRAQRGGGI